MKAAKEIEKKGDSCLSTGLLKWTKDLAGAATYYDDAVKKYVDLGAWADVIHGLLGFESV